MKKSQLQQIIREEISNVKILQYFQKDKDAKNGFYIFKTGTNTLSKYSPDYKDVEKYKNDDNHIIVSLKNGKTQIIKEEIQNALTEALKINSNPNSKSKNQIGFKDTTVNKTTRADRDSVFDGVEIIQPGSGGLKTVFIPSSEFPKLIAFLQQSM